MTCLLLRSLPAELQAFLGGKAPREVQNCKTPKGGGGVPVPSRVGERHKNNHVCTHALRYAQQWRYGRTTRATSVKEAASRITKAAWPSAP